MRALLSNLLSDADTPADIDALSVAAHAGSRIWFDACAGARAAELTDDEIEDMRPQVYEAIAGEQKAPCFVKIHDAFGYTRSGEPIVSTRATLGAVYIIRNPLDVAVAYAHHRQVDVDAMIQTMADEAYSLGGGRHGIMSQLKQRLGSWSTHVLSWVDAAGIRLRVVRYEDMQQDPGAAFGAVADFAAVPYTPARLRQAIAFSAFPELRRQEDENGRNTKSDAPRFFRRGEAGAWRHELTRAQVHRIVDTHGAVMRRFGYLDADGTPR